LPAYEWGRPPKGRPRSPSRQWSLEAIRRGPETRPGPCGNRAPVKMERGLRLAVKDAEVTSPRPEFEPQSPHHLRPVYPRPSQFSRFKLGQFRPDHMGLPPNAGSSGPLHCDDRESNLTPLIKQRKNSEDAHLSLGKARNGDFRDWLGSAMIHL
jgi:hypothetical protein